MKTAVESCILSEENLHFVSRKSFKNFDLIDGRREAYIMKFYEGAISNRKPEKNTLYEF